VVTPPRLTEEQRAWLNDPATRQAMTASQYLILRKVVEQDGAAALATRAVRELQKLERYRVDNGLVAHEPGASDRSEELSTMDMDADVIRCVREEGSRMEMEKVSSLIHPEAVSEDSR
jgi:hypothetical protein